MLYQVCAECRNWFSTENERHIGKFIIQGGVLAPLDFLQNEQYFRIIGSTFNDGIYQYPEVNLRDEEFDGAIWSMKIPPEFLKLVAEIEAYQKTEAAEPSAITSESFAGYSYSKATDNKGLPASWRDVFRTKLNKWRRL